MISQCPVGKPPDPRKPRERFMELILQKRRMLRVGCKNLAALPQEFESYHFLTASAIFPPEMAWKIAWGCFQAHGHILQCPGKFSQDGISFCYFGCYERDNSWALRLIFITTDFSALFYCLLHVCWWVLWPSLPKLLPQLLLSCYLSLFCLLAIWYASHLTLSFIFSVTPSKPLKFFKQPG